MTEPVWVCILVHSNKEHVLYPTLWTWMHVYQFKNSWKYGKSSDETYRLLDKDGYTWFNTKTEYFYHFVTPTEVKHKTNVRVSHFTWGVRMPLHDSFFRHHGSFHQRAHKWDHWKVSAQFVQPTKFATVRVIARPPSGTSTTLHHMLSVQKDKWKCLYPKWCQYRNQARTNIHQF